MVFGFLKGGNPREAIFKATKASYDKHYALAQRRGIEPIQMGLFGALTSRYRLRRIFKDDTIHLLEIAPFAMMDEEDAVAALALYLLMFEIPAEVDAEAIRRWINEAIEHREGPVAEDAYNLLLATGPAIANFGIPWVSWLSDIVIKQLDRHTTN